MALLKQGTKDCTGITILASLILTVLVLYWLQFTVKDAATITSVVMTFQNGRGQR